jgi:hypothetical protein
MRYENENVVLRASVNANHHVNVPDNVPAQVHRR